MPTDRQRAQSASVGAVLGGRYRLLRILGEGGAGVVYEAEDTAGARFAIKLLVGMAQRADAAARHAREARLMSKLSSPHVTHVLDSGVDASTGAPYLVMELLDGEDLASCIARTGGLAPSLAARILVQACAGVEAAHAAGFVHRDIKPSNLFLHRATNGELVVKVSDFGLAKPLFGEDSMTASGSIVGSPLYLSPEQATDSKRVDGRSDVWSLGMTLYELLTGQAAFEGAANMPELLSAISTKDAPPVQAKAPWVPEPLAMVVHGTLIRDPNARCPNVGAFADALRPLAGSMRMDPTMLEPVPIELRVEVAARAQLPQSWSQVEARTKSLPPPADTESTMVRVLGRTLGGRYPLLRVLGRGGMGAVYETLGPKDERLAVKVILDDVLRRKPEVAARFVREARASMAIDSDHVVRIVDADTDASQQAPFIVMELLEGQDLASLLKTAGPLEPSSAVRFFVQACRGLAAAHAKGIVHRDIKPANIFAHERASGVVVAKICDFGIAKELVIDDGAATSTDLTQTGGVLGSPMYFSPEQARNAKRVDARTDVWSLGVSLYEALAGVGPWQACSTVGEIIIAVCTQDPPPLGEVAPWLPSELVAIVHRCLARDPAARFASMDELAASLEPLASSAPLTRERLVQGAAGRPKATPRFPSRDDAGATTVQASTVQAMPRAPRSRAWTVALVGVAAVAAASALIAMRAPAARVTELALPAAQAPSAAVDAAPVVPVPLPVIATKRATLMVSIPVGARLRVDGVDLTAQVSAGGLPLSAPAHTKFNVSVESGSTILAAQVHVLQDDDELVPPSVVVKRAPSVRRLPPKTNLTEPRKPSKGPEMDTNAE